MGWVNTRWGYFNETSYVNESSSLGFWVFFCSSASKRYGDWYVGLSAESGTSVPLPLVHPFRCWRMSLEIGVELRCSPDFARDLQIYLWAVDGVWKSWVCLPYSSSNFFSNSSMALQNTIILWRSRWVSLFAATCFLKFAPSMLLVDDSTLTPVYHFEKIWDFGEVDYTLTILQPAGGKSFVIE